MQDCVNRLAFTWKHDENKYCLKTKHSCSNGIIKTCETGCKWYIGFAWSKTAHEAEKENGYQLWHLISMNFLKHPPQRELHNKMSTTNIKIYCIIKLYICFNLFETKTIMRTTAWFKIPFFAPSPLLSMALLQFICTVHEKTVMQANKKATLTNIQQRFTVEPMSAHKELQHNSEERREKINCSIFH